MVVNVGATNVSAALEHEPPLNVPLENEAAVPAVTSPFVFLTSTFELLVVTVIVGVLTVPAGV